MSQYFKTPRNQTALWLMGPYSISQDYPTMSDSLSPSTTQGVPPSIKIVVSCEGIVDNHCVIVCLVFSKNIYGSDSEIFLRILPDVP
jgi:hypothetical protein